MSSLDLKFLHNSQNHLAILRLDFFYSNLSCPGPHLENVKFKFCGAIALNLTCT
ncbi:hypothetical protein CAMSH0001_0874 [Campylobacter showae RM3277]|uniref:Uncharacterized protein n=1 Tax=Campylobacter showae RM3277 TaxID=553219 RepID=C6RHP7_9BACT|nr:hypothetical protein CAMSH0001_0874 [Campylobacter showae RM3277]